MTIISEISTIPFWRVSIAIVITLLGIMGAGIIGIKISKNGFTIGSTLAIFLSVAAYIIGMAWTTNCKPGDNSSEGVARYEVVIDDNKVTSDTLEKIQKNYEIIESKKIGYMTKASIQGPRYKTVFSEDEITIDYQ